MRRCKLILLVKYITLMLFYDLHDNSFCFKGLYIWYRCKFSIFTFVCCMYMVHFIFFRTNITRCSNKKCRQKKRREYEAKARINTHMSFLRLVNVQETRSENKGNSVLFSIESHHIRQRKKKKKAKPENTTYSFSLWNDFSSILPISETEIERYNEKLIHSI